ncbi:DUF4199 domain-containing protein [Algoriphagus namhaensis]
MKNRSIEFKWAIIFTLVALAWMYLEKALGWHDQHIADHPVYTNLFAILAIAVYVFALIDKKRNSFQGKMIYKQGFISGLIITLFITILTPLTQYITHTIITPEYFSNVQNYSVEIGKLTQEEAEAYFNLDSYMLQATVGAFVMGVITSAIVAFFVKSK